MLNWVQPLYNIFSVHIISDIFKNTSKSYTNCTQFVLRYSIVLILIYRQILFSVKFMENPNQLDINNPIDSLNF